MNKSKSYHNPTTKRRDVCCKPPDSSARRTAFGLTLCAAIALLISQSGCAPDSKTIRLTPEQQRLNVESFDYAWTTIRDHYWNTEFNGLDWSAVRDEIRPCVEQAATSAQARCYMNKMIARLGKSHFGIIPAEAYDSLGDVSQKGDMDGDVGLDARIIDGRMLVTHVVEDSPADRAGIKTGWEFVKIKGKDIAPQINALNEQLTDNHSKIRMLDAAAVSRLSGPIGESLPLAFRTGDDSIVEYELEFVPKRGRKYKFGHIPAGYVWIETRLLDQNVGYIAFNSFMDPAHLMPVFNEAMKSFENADGVILDVRGNGGGIGAMAMGMAGWFVTEKSRYLGTLTTREAVLKLIVNPRMNAYTGPLAILVDHMSGSSSEFLAGGLQDLERACVVGSRTAGAALPSAIEKLPNGDGFQYAFGNYVSAGGQELEGDGVTPDIQVAHTREALLQGRDLVLEAAIDWIQSQ